MQKNFYILNKKLKKTLNVHFKIKFVQIKKVLLRRQLKISKKFTTTDFR